jgi:chemotaxis protein methyltransferase CheR
MSSDHPYSKRDTKAGPRILLTNTNRWPVVPRLVIAFRALGCEVGVLCPTPERRAQNLASVGSVFHYDGLAPTESLTRAIEAFAPDAIVPSCDRGVRHLHEIHADSLSRDIQGRKIATLIERSLGSPKGFPLVASRSDLLKIAKSEGILVPTTAAIESKADLKDWSTAFSLPWVIKADGTWGGQGVKIVNSSDQAACFLDEFGQRRPRLDLLSKLAFNRDRDWIVYDWKHSQKAVIVQSMITGRPANCAVVCWQGKVLAGIAVEVIETRGATGPATIVQVVPGSEMIAAAEKIAERLSISGFFGLDFMIEGNTGSVYLIEMNPRCTPPCPLPLGEGRDLIAAFCAQLSANEAPQNRPAIQQSFIAYFPRAIESIEEVASAGQGDSIYRDIPQGEPTLLHGLLHPRSGRTILGQFVDIVRQKDHQEPYCRTSAAPSRRAYWEEGSRQMPTEGGVSFSGSTILRMCLRPYFSQAKRVWNHLSPSIRNHGLGRAYAKHLDRVVRLQADRKQYFATFFLRNRPELQLLCRLLSEKPHGSRVNIAVLACSKGAEVYSIIWAVRSVRPDLQIELHAIDISEEIVNFAQRGVYSIDIAVPAERHGISDNGKSVAWNTSRDQNAWMFERMSKEEIAEMFEITENQASIRPYLRQGITWMCADAASCRLREAIGPQDVVVANRFLCHMEPDAATSCLREIAKMVKPGGHLFVSGIDLDVRTRVAVEMGWRPVPDLLREVHNGDDSIRRGWPVEYWGLEPLDDHRADWKVRYASVFEVGVKPYEPAELAGAEYAGR